MSIETATLFLKTIGHNQKDTIKTCYEVKVIFVYSCNKVNPISPTVPEVQQGGQYMGFSIPFGAIS